jgi:predicted nucleic acid-binding protein
VIVIDGSALVVAVADTSERGWAIQERLAEGAAAPHLIDAEVGQALRNLVLRGALDPHAAYESLIAADALVTERHPIPELWPRAWQVRHNVSFYDALYVALAEATGLPLVTADARIARADGPRCRVEVV